MSRLEELNRINSVPILDVNSDAFKRYGRVIEDIDAGALIEYLEIHTQIPEQGNVYVASDPEMETIPAVAQLQKDFYAGRPVQCGYCNGKNSTYNGFEYHKGSEINVAATDLILVLGRREDISEDLTYHVDTAQPFFLEKGTVVELYQDTLHLSPLRTQDSGFKAAVVLQRGTNTSLTNAERAEAKRAAERGDKNARLLLQRNKWVISHPDREPLMKQGAWPGVLGENRELKY
ncbi:MAG: DUF4867 family protein [Firmicutes bacterium]|nr:DUF4867 family protein [Bacillota bacterium]